MMNDLIIQKDVPLAPLTTFGTGGSAKYFASLTSPLDVLDIYVFARTKNLPIMIFGGGSNVVVSDRGYEGLVLSIDISGTEVIKETEDAVMIRVGSGEDWDNVVAWTVQNGWWGLENLSSIPGKTGGLAIQNVGAYGAEASQVIESVDVYDTKEDKTLTLPKEQCKFEYRKSIFNTTEKGRYIVLSIIMELSKKPNPKTSYSDIIEYLSQYNINNPTVQEMREAIITIRKRKFPDITETGTAGSFFKNLYINEEQYQETHSRILKKYGEEKADALEVIKNKFPSESGIKIPTAFIIDQVLGLKGTRIGGAQVSPTQALAIINPEKTATSDDVRTLVQKVRQEVYCATGIAIDVEPQFIGFTNEELKEMYTLKDCE